jgi:RNA polymerase sigma-70 factor, ECF subfamily
MSPSRGNDPGSTRLYREFGGLAYVMAMRILGDRQLAEDAVQEAWIRISRELDRGVTLDFEQSYVLTITRNEALRIATRRGHVPMTMEPLAPPDPDMLEVREQRRILEKALSALPEEDRELLRLRFVDQRPSAELRRRFGFPSRNSLFKRLKNAKERLRRALRRP